MNNFFRFFKKNKTDTILVFVLLFFTYIAWHLLPQMIIRGDGFVYFLSNTQKAFFTIPLFFTGFENSAMIFGYIFPKIFGVNIALYLWAELLIMMAINILLYFTLKIITKRRIVSFTASLFFAVSYFGLWDMVTTHCYCFFLERVIPMVLLVPSFLFLHLFLERNKKKYYLVSSLFYFFGVGIGHFTVLLTPLYLFYPIFWALFTEKKIRKKIIGVLYGLSYLGQSAFFILIQQINESGLGPHNWTFTEFLFHPERYLYFKKIALQFVYWSQYPMVLRNYNGELLLAIVDSKIAPVFIPSVLLAYIIASVIIFKILPKQRPMLFTIIFGTITIFYLNAYFGQYDILNFSGASRYLYFPTFFLAIFWAYFLWAIFWQVKSKVLTIIGIVLVAFYYLINVWLIGENFAYITRRNWSTKAVLDYVVMTRDRLPKNTLVIAPSPEFGIQESTFFTERLGRSEARYMSEHNPDDVDTWEKQASISANVIRIKYNRSCACIAEEKIK